MSLVPYPDIASLPEITDAGILSFVSSTDTGSFVSRCIVRDEKLKVLVGLAKQRVD